MGVDKNLLKIMACPKCKGDLEERGMFITCKKCRLAFPVLNEKIPDMLIDDAWDIGKARKAGFRHKLKI